MSKAKIAITIDKPILARIDRLVAKQVFSSRSQAIEAAVEEKIERLAHGRLARECAKLDPAFEKALAEEGLSQELDEWPEY
ncbi:ribbon-helix-helix domain-containing protein [Nitrosococcus oceani]|uniref:Helix-turn-helix protein, CopG family n=2 Tax=Nitrosococcus oceani TaxID=1229 RepID=Q3JAU9_NITOC|nr:ribbon-helix-helix domain-containing protein [Nitrosococcus oceani]KFI19519.1 CopG family transcriptional regulator [Nitrosococcus oceani C-27]ABA58047.1 Helix-turn-helix protein, CopG family [Nitrosococcus oceani ATCC 19707]EDZ67117.1 Ribbon-helix-helix protein, copG family [Nitrosococcus oceani AFC27]KFI22793.1 CopG family transcriptional regulator [Nitrosococcus oceani]GEM20986.1 CopG family transcriptional regulator [Nitrosococcus oceani]